MYGVKREELAVEGEKTIKIVLSRFKIIICSKNIVCIYEEYKKIKRID